MSLKLADLLETVRHHPRRLHRADTSLTKASIEDGSAQAWIAERTLSPYVPIAPFLQQDDVMNNSHALSRAEAVFAKQQKQKTEGEAAWAEYRRKQEHELTKTERLRKLRLERDRC